MNSQLTLVEHLNELRKRIIVCLVVLMLAAIIAMPFSGRLLEFLKVPAQGTLPKLAFFSPQEGIMVYFKLAFFAALIVSLPVILYNLWAFISPALEERFRKFTLLFVVSVFISFILGAYFAYELLLPAALKFLLGFARDSLEPVISVSKYVSFVTVVILGCGVVFEMPVLSFILSKIGMINANFLRRKSKYALLFIFIIAAIITPTPDVFNMTLLAIPMLFLYEISILVAWLARPKFRG